jgi:hypothetical protein
MITRWSRAIAGAAAALVVAALGAAPRPAHALGACDWRRPDQDIRRLFPGADDYHPIYKRAFQLRDTIEPRLGYRLAGWEDLIRFYQIMKDDRRVGTIYVHLTPDGTEIVVGITNEGAVKGVLIQKYQGNLKDQLESPQFLGQFAGKTLAAPFEVGKDIKAACPALESPCAAVALTVRKLLVFYSVYG